MKTIWGLLTYARNKATGNIKKINEKKFSYIGVSHKMAQAINSKVPYNIRAWPKHVLLLLGRVLSQRYKAEVVFQRPA
jgi:hypothetical protein